MDKTIISEIEKHKAKIEEIDESTMHSGVFQALHQLRQALNHVEKSLNERDYEKASSLGYSEVASEFIFLQRTLGGLQDCVHDKQKLIQDIAYQTRLAYEDVAPQVEQQMDSLKPAAKKSEMIDISIGEKSIQKLNELHQIRGTSVEHIIEHIVAKALKEDATVWQGIEEQKPIRKTRRGDKANFSSDRLDELFEDMATEVQEAMDNLY